MIFKKIKFPKNVTMKKFNELIKDSGYMLIKGTGYFYFSPQDDADVPMLSAESELVHKFRNITPEDWYERFQQKLKDIRL